MKRDANDRPAYLLDYLKVLDDVERLRLRAENALGTGEGADVAADLERVEQILRDAQPRLTPNCGL